MELKRIFKIETGINFINPPKIFQHSSKYGIKNIVISKQHSDNSKFDVSLEFENTEENKKQNIVLNYILDSVVAMPIIAGIQNILQIEILDSLVSPFIADESQNIAKTDTTLPSQMSIIDIDSLLTTTIENILIEQDDKEQFSFIFQLASNYSFYYFFVDDIYFNIKLKLQRK